MSELSTKEAAAHLEVGFSTMKTWCSELPIPLRMDAAGARRIGPEGLAVLEQVKALRDQGRHLESIRAILEPALAETGPGSVPPPAAAQSEPGPSRPPVDQAELAQVVAAAAAQAVQAAVAQENELAEKYARACYEIGELRATVKALHDKLAHQLEPGPSPELAQALAAIEEKSRAEISLRIKLVAETAARERLALEAKLADQVRELEKKDRQLQELRVDATPSGARPWWRFWS